MASVPGAPLPDDPTNITSTSFFIKFTKGSSNGAAQSDWNIRYADNLNFSNAKTLAIYPEGGTITGLRSSTSYFAQIRARNAIGWGPWSRVVRADTLATPVKQPAAPDPVPTQTPTTPPAVPPPAPPSPSAPPIYLPGTTDPFYIDAQGANGFHYSFHAPGYLGGGSIQELQVGYGTDPDNVQYTTSVGLYGGNGDAFVNGLNRNTVYYVWSRARNETGWGDWSRRYDVRTRSNLPAAPSPTGIDNVTQTSVRFSFRGEDDGGAAIEEWQIGYSNDASTIQIVVNADGGPPTVNGLSPFTDWYFWARARNAEGWSAWSVRSEVRTKAGALIYSNGAYRDAIPYVKIDGVWRIARPFVKRTGLWKTTF